MEMGLFDGLTNPLDILHQLIGQPVTAKNAGSSSQTFVLDKSAMNDEVIFCHDHPDR
jgi:hypothetical protein